MVQTAERTTSTPWAALAGALLVLLGLANAALGVLSLTTDLVRLTPATAGQLLAVGVATGAAGVLVWRGSQAALTVALTVFALLLVVQLGDLTSSSGDHSDAVPRLVVLAVIVAVLWLARTRLRGSRRR